MKKLSKISIVLLGTLLLASVAHANLLTTFTTSIAANDPTQLVGVRVLYKKLSG